jgi:pilus assembly protein CpaB
VIGYRARTDIAVGQPILSSLAVPDLTALAATGSDLALLIPPDRVAIAVPTVLSTSVAGGLQPGDYVDLIISLLYIEIDEEFQSRLPNNISLIGFTIDPATGNIVLSYSETMNGRIESAQIPLAAINPASFTANTFYVEWPILESPSEAPRPRLVTNRTVQNALVLYVGNLPPNGRIFENTPTPAPTATLETTAAQQRTTEQEGQAIVPAPTEVSTSPFVTLAVSPQEAVVIAHLIESRIPITFVMRPASGAGEAPTEPVSLAYISSRYHVEDPGRQEVSIEPAIRSIRQMMLEQTITFGE